MAARSRPLAETSGVVRRHPELVVLPGLGIRPYLAPLVRALAEWTAVTVLDLPGWAWAGRRRCDPEVAAVGAAAAAWLAAGRGRKVVLVGHSTGSQAALHAARQASHRLLGVVLASPVFPPGGRRLGGLAAGVAEALPYESWAELPRVVPACLASRVGPMWRLMRSGQRADTEALVQACPVPVGVVTGRQDAVAPTWFASRLAELAGTTCHLHPAGHNAVFTDPVGVDFALRRAVGDLTRGPVTPG